MATITFDQTGLSAGILDRSRSDGLDDGTTVTITVAPSGGTVEFVDVPPADSSAVVSLGQVDPSTWTFDPTASVYGTWLVQYTDPSSNVVRRTFGVRTPGHGLRIPAFNEKASQSATIANGATYIAVSDDNEDGTYDGWSKTIREIYEEVESGAPNSHAPSHQNGGLDEISVTGLSGLLADAQTPLTHAPSHQNGGGDEISVTGLSGLLADAQTPLAHAPSHQHGGSDQISTATPGANEIPKALASGKLAVGWTSLTQSTVTGPATPTAALNSLSLCDVSGGAVTINLPAGHVAGDAVIIKLSSVATNTVTIDPDGSETIDGAATLVLTTDYEWAWLISNGTNWFQIS